jgi:hypothetical protein
LHLNRNIETVEKIITSPRSLVVVFWTLLIVTFQEMR